MGRHSARRVQRSDVATSENLTTTDDLFVRLGMTTRANPDVIAHVRRGFPVRVIDRLSKALGMPQARLLSLVALPQATYARRRASKRLSPQESDRIYRIASVYRDVVRFFAGDEDAAREWLTSSAIGLGNKVPVDLLDTAAGAEVVRTLIGRLESGVVA